MPRPQDAAVAETVLYEVRAQGGIDPHELLAGFIDRTGRLLNLVEGIMPEAEWLGDAETLTYLHSCVSTKGSRVRVPETPMHRSEERRVGKECVSTCRSRGSP